MTLTRKDKKELKELAAMTAAGGAVGIFGCFVFLLAFGLGLSILAALIYLLMNVLLPIIGVTYILTWGQCFVAALALTIVKLLIKGIVSVKVEKS